MLCIDVDRLDVEGRVLTSLVVDPVGRVVGTNVATPLSPAGGALSVAEVGDFVHVQPNAVHWQKIVVELGELGSDYVMMMQHTGVLLLTVM